MITVRLTYVEARAAVAAARRARRLTASGHERAKVRLDALWGELASVKVSRRVVELAAGLAERHALRANNAVHLAAALIVRAPLIATWDRELRRAAEEAGLAVAPYG